MRFFYREKYHKRRFIVEFRRNLLYIFLYQVLIKGTKIFVFFVPFPFIRIIALEIKDYFDG